MIGGDGLLFFKGKIPSLIRLLYVGFMIFVQTSFFILIAMQLQVHAFWIYLFCEVVSIVMVLMLLNKDGAAVHKLGWIVVIVVLPVTGILMYVQWGSRTTHAKNHNQIKKIVANGQEYQEKWSQNKIAQFELNSQQKRLMEYLCSNGFPVYKHTEISYYSIGETAFQQIMLDLKHAERYIFMEFFIVATGSLWQEIHEILLEKVKEGVEVRLLYDDWGTLITLPTGYDKQLQKEGIQTRIFNPVQQYLSKLQLNYRNHQKIISVDGMITYTGGANLADEYVNRIEKHGHWKDQMIRLYGGASVALTIFFMEMWDGVQNQSVSQYHRYIRYMPVVERGYCQPFVDGPALRPHYVARDVILQMIHLSTEFLYITTPYFVVEQEIIKALQMVALGGVKVILVLPSIPDHKNVQILSRSQYGKLISSGVKIYEYQKGFIHSKMIINEFAAVVGTINMDYRSLYLHYECGVVLYQDYIRKELIEDFLQIIDHSRKIEFSQWEKRSYWIKCKEQILHLFGGFI